MKESDQSKDKKARADDKTQMRTWKKKLDTIRSQEGQLKGTTDKQQKVHQSVMMLTMTLGKLNDKIQASDDRLGRMKKRHAAEVARRQKKMATKQQKFTDRVKMYKTALLGLSTKLKQVTASKDINQQIAAGIIKNTALKKKQEATITKLTGEIAHMKSQVQSVSSNIKAYQTKADQRHHALHTVHI